MRQTCKKNLLAGAAALGIALAVCTAFPQAALAQNADCLLCHESSLEFDVVPVDRETACPACHTPGLLGTHPYHQAGANCGAICHSGWGDSLYSAIPMYLTPAGSFASASSLDASPAVLHQIHATPRWPEDVSTSVSECASCHLPASCTACHTDSVSGAHEAHSSSDNTSWTGVVCFGIIGEDQMVQSATLESNYCSTADCHDVAGVVARAPLMKEDFSHAAYPEYGYPEANTVTKVGIWSTQRSTAYTGGQQSLSNDSGASLSLTFECERIALMGDLDPYRGHAEVWLDGEYQETIDCYSPITRRQQVLWTSDRLAHDSHTIEVRIAGTKNSSSRGTWVAVDAFRAYGNGSDSIAPDCTDTCHTGLTAGHTAGSHALHISADDPRGPGDLACTECHATGSYPFFAAGTDTDGSGHVELDETTVCDECHSPGGDYNGVDSTVTASGRISIGAKDHWGDQVYETTTTLQAGKEKWCVGCHDGVESATGDAASRISGVFAPPVAGGEDTDYRYGVGWGFYETGHGTPSSTVIASNGFDAGPDLECDDCHDSSQLHIDGDRRSFAATDTPDDYRTDYRLDLVDGENPMLIPRPWSSGNTPDSYRLCTQSGCHDPYPFITETVEASSNPSLRRTNFWNENRDIELGHNMHLLHIGMNQNNRWAPDWGPTRTSLVTCVSCHNVHGTTQLGMIHDGSLISDTVTRTPGLRMWYKADGLIEWIDNNQYPPTPEDITLAMSDGWIWSGGSSGNLCSHCHGNFNTMPVERTMWQDYGIVPVLDWVSALGYEDDGANPDVVTAADDVQFKISYSDANNDAPIFVNLLIDLNDDGDFDDAGETNPMSPETPSDTTYYDGNPYNVTLKVAKAGDGQLDYQFETTDGVTGGSTTPTRTLTVVNDGPHLAWTGETGYVLEGVTPNGGNSGVESFEFRVLYQDADDEGPIGGAPTLHIDKNDDGDYDDPGESITMADMGDPSVVDGKRYNHTTTLTRQSDDTINYYFSASDGIETGQSDVSTVTVVPNVNAAPSLAWTGEAEYVDDGADPETQAATKPFEFRVEYTDANNDAPGAKQLWIDLDDSSTYEPAEKFDMTQTVVAEDPGMTDGDQTNGEIYAGKVYVPYAGDGTLDYCFHFDDGVAAATGVQETDRDITVYQALYVPSVYATIQLAVDASSDGDTVLVADGTYAPFAYNGKDIVVESVNGRANTTIKTASGTGYVVNFNEYSGSGSDSTIRGFTIRDAQTGITTAKSDVTIEDCIIENITFNGAIYHTGDAADPLVVRNSIIRNNTRFGVRIANNEATATILDTAFNNNTSPFGGGAINGNGTWNIERCSFDNNSTTAWGGAIYCGGYIDLRLSDSTFTNNTSSNNHGGALYFMGNDAETDAVIERCVFAGNSATANGGALMLRLGDYEITNSTISGNYAGGYGGGIYSSSNSRPVYTNCTIAGNSADIGGGLYEYTWAGNEPAVLNCILWGNDSRSSVMDQLDGEGLLRVIVQYADIDQSFTGFADQVGNMRSAPYFVNAVPPSSAPTSTGDYHLQPISPCEGRASATYAPADDIDGGVRPNGTGDDMGSDEIGTP